MIQENNKLQEGLNSINRIKLLMGYDMGKTLNENLNEQSVIGAPNYGVTSTPPSPPKPKKVNLTPQQLQYQKEHPEMVWDPNALDDTKPSLNQQGKTVYPKGKFVPLTPENVGLRGVPFGFSPTEYPEYVKKVKEINKKYPKSETSINPTTWFNSNDDDKREKLLSDLKKEYYRPEFWKGITKQDYLNYKSAKSKLNKEKEKELRSRFLKDRELNSLTMYPEKEARDKYWKNRKSGQKASLDYSQAIAKYDTMDVYLDTLFDYDPSAFEEINKSALEKFFDKYKYVGELAFWLALDLLTDSMAEWVTAPRQAYVFGKVISAMGGVEKTAAAIRFMGSSLVPIALGVDDIIRNSKVTEDSIIYFIFAVLPYAHSLFKISSAPTKELCGSIISKMSNYNIRTPEGLSSFIKTLTESEKSVVRKILTMDKDSLANGIKQTMSTFNKEITELASKNPEKFKQIISFGKSAGKTLSKNYTKLLYDFSKRMFVDIAAIEVVKKITLELGITLDDVRQKQLIQLIEESKKDPIKLAGIIKNAILIMKQNPNWKIDDIIKQSTIGVQNKNSKEENEVNKQTYNTLKQVITSNEVEKMWDID